MLEQLAPNFQITTSNAHQKNCWSVNILNYISNDLKTASF